MYWVMGILPFALLLLGFPIFLLLLITSLVILFGFFDIPMTVVAQDIFNSLNKYALLAVPFFVFAGNVMSRGGISVRLLRWVESLIGGFRAHIPFTSLGFAALFGATSGVTTAATAAIGTLTYPRMREAGYSEGFAAALITSEGALDNLIPPSIAMIIYGIAADTSIIQLWTAGIGPCLLLASFFGCYIYYHSVKVGITDAGRFSLKELLHSTRDGIWSLGAIVVIIGGIYSGVFSPTEAAGVASVYAIVISYFVYREVTAAELFDIAARSMYLTGLIFIIVAIAGLYSWLLTISGIAQAIVTVITSSAFRALGGAAGHQSVSAVHRLFPRSGLGPDHAGAAVGAGCRLARRRPDPFRRHRRHEFDDRHVPSAVRIEHFRLSGAVQDAVGDAV